MATLIPEVWARILQDKLDNASRTVYRDWFRFLEEQGVLTPTASAAFQEYVLSSSKYPRPVRNQVGEFAMRMRDENPELWLVFKTKRRLLGRGGDE